MVHAQEGGEQVCLLKTSKMINRGSNPSKPFDDFRAFTMKGSTIEKRKAVKIDVPKQKFMKNL